MDSDGQDRVGGGQTHTAGELEADLRTNLRTAEADRDRRPVKSLSPLRISLWTMFVCCIYLCRCTTGCVPAVFKCQVFSISSVCMYEKYCLLLMNTTAISQQRKSILYEVPS